MNGDDVVVVFREVLREALDTFSLSLLSLSPSLSLLLYLEIPPPLGLCFAPHLTPVPSGPYNTYTVPQSLNSSFSPSWRSGEEVRGVRGEQEQHLPDWERPGQRAVEATEGDSEEKRGERAKRVGGGLQS